MSGGVDSSVSAALLTRSGEFDVRGVFMKTWTPPGYPCTWKEEQKDAMRAAAHLGIPFATWDLSRVYEKEVVSYMQREFLRGRTPNPDVMCNKHIKFGLFLKEALRQGAPACRQAGIYIATGHYARLRRKLKNKNEKLKLIELACARDVSKDQSYFLWTLGQEQLRHCLFPVGEYTKTKVRELAHEFGLHNAEKRDSQGLCFVGNLDFADFLRTQLPQRAGALVTADGREIGEHDGAHFYTVGQRRGLGVGGGIPYYVTNIDTAVNVVTVSVGEGDELYAREVRFAEANWISGQPPQFPLHCSARIRYRQPLQYCRIEKSDSEKTVYAAIFDEPQRAVTPGQSIVFYKKDILLGGGVIAD